MEKHCDRCEYPINECICDEEDDDSLSEEDYKELEEERLIEMAYRCTCGSWKISDKGLAVHVADCICGNGD